MKAYHTAYLKVVGITVASGWSLLFAYDLQAMQGTSMVHIFNYLTRVVGFTAVCKQSQLLLQRRSMCRRPSNSCVVNVMP